MQIQPSMFPDLVPTKLDIVVPYIIDEVSNYRVSSFDNGRNIALVSCCNQWPVSGGMVRCKGKNSVYHYQWMMQGNVARCSKCGCKWMYDRKIYDLAHNSELYTGNTGIIDPSYPLIDTEQE